MKFRHAVYDGLFSDTDIKDAADTWPAPDWSGWGVVYRQDQQRKRACNRWEDMPEYSRRLLAEMLFIDTSAFGIGPLIADSGLWGGGMQDMGADEFLGLHLDADIHKLSGLSRRLNAILFLSPQWQDGWGGELALHDATGIRQCPLVTIAPRPGRLVLFATGDDTWHAVRRLTCPPDVRRMTLACWWYGKADGAGKRDRALFAPPATSPVPSSPKGS